VKFFNHTQGYLGEKIYEGMSESPFEIKVSDCPDTRTIDPNRIAVREAINGGWIGRKIGYSSGGKVANISIPRGNVAYDAFLMNTANGADYGLIDNHVSRYAGEMFHTPNARWWREDISGGGPEEAPREAMAQIKAALAFPWAKYMDFTEVPRDPYKPAGDFFVGWNIPDELPSSGWRGFTHEFGVWVNPDLCQTQGHPLFRVFLEFIFRHCTGCRGYTGEVAPVGSLTYQYISDDGGLNNIGRDLLAYVPVKSKYSAY
jgi:hypothetical protein